MYRVLSIINIILVFIPIIFSVKYFMIYFKDRSTLLNVVLLILFSWALLDYCEAFYLSSFADYALEEFLEKGHSLGEIIKYMTSASIASILGFIVRGMLEKRKVATYGSDDERWEKWLKSGKTRK